MGVRYGTATLPDKPALMRPLGDQVEFKLLLHYWLHVLKTSHVGQLVSQVVFYLHLIRRGLNLVGPDIRIGHGFCQIQLMQDALHPVGDVVFIAPLRGLAEVYTILSEEVPYHGFTGPSPV